MNSQQEAQKVYEEKLASRFIMGLNHRLRANFVLDEDLRYKPQRSLPEFVYTDAGRNKPLALELTTIVRHDQIIAQVKRGLEFAKKLREQVSRNLAQAFILDLPCEAVPKRGEEGQAIKELSARIAEIAPHLTRTSRFEEQSPFPWSLSVEEESGKELLISLTLPLLGNDEFKERLKKVAKEANDKKFVDFEGYYRTLVVDVSLFEEDTSMLCLLSKQTWQLDKEVEKDFERIDAIYLAQTVRAWLASGGRWLPYHKYQSEIERLRLTPEDLTNKEIYEMGYWEPFEPLYLRRGIW
jgi:hypothetical protein